MADYEIRVKGHLDQRWGGVVRGLEITNLEDGEAVLSGDLPDQAALHGVLNKYAIWVYRSSLLPAAVWVRRSSPSDPDSN